MVSRSASDASQRAYTRPGGNSARLKARGAVPAAAAAPSAAARCHRDSLSAERLRPGQRSGHTAAGLGVPACAHRAPSWAALKRLAKRGLLLVVNGAPIYAAANVHERPQRGYYRVTRGIQDSRPEIC